MEWINNPTWSKIKQLPNNTNYYGPELPTRITLIGEISTSLNILDFGAGIGRNRDYLNDTFRSVDEYDLPEFGYKNLIDIANKKYDLINACFTFQFMDKAHIIEAVQFLEKSCDTFYLTTRTYCNTGENVLQIFLDLGYKVISANRNVDLFTKLHSEDCGEFIVSKSHFPISYTESYNLGKLTYLSYQDVFNDVRQWCKTLDVSAVCGVPRSGIIIASMISQIKNIPLCPIEIFTNDFTTWRPESSRKLKEYDFGPVLFVDDTSWSGTSMFLLRKKLRNSLAGLMGNYKFGAVYVSPQSNLLHYKKLPHVTHTFDWNFLRDINVGHYCIDFDGVLCEDFAGGDSEDNDYSDFLENAKPLYLPNYPVKKIVSARLEKYRPQTEKWLQKHGVVCGELCLLKVTSHKKRNLTNAVEHKSRNYDPDALLFVESCPVQAAEISKQTGRRVFCTDEWRMYDNQQRGNI